MLGSDKVDVAVQVPIQDPVTHEVFTPLQPVMTFVREQPHLNARGRDFLHIVPIQTSQNGYGNVYLWIGTSSSIDRGVSNVSALTKAHSGATALLIDLDTKLDTKEVLLPLVAWRPGQHLARIVAMPTTSYGRSALGFKDLNQLMHNNPKRIVLVEASGERYEYTYQSGEWSPY